MILQNEIFRIAKQIVKERQDITGSNCLKGVSGSDCRCENGLKIHGRSIWKSWWMKRMKRNLLLLFVPMPAVAEAWIALVTLSVRVSMLW